jgi:D-glycero-alpha-D-manno-heptose-7-phosphate kinase
VIISRTPLRISLGGGGTDLPSYYERFGGFVVSAAITKYLFIGVNETFTPDYSIKYSVAERVTTIDAIEHPIFREALRYLEVEPGVEIVSLADIPAGTGLGSSGAFTVGLLRALYAERREHVTAGALAEDACRIEIDVLQRAVGKQDQYIGAFGGITCFEFDKDGSVHVSPLSISNDTLHDLESHLLMFFTGYSREADEVLVDQKERSERDDAAMLENLHAIKQLGLDVKHALEAGDTRGFAALMHEHWEMKRGRTKGMSNDVIDRWYELGLANGALGGKLVGAGGGGFLLFYSPDPMRLRSAMTGAGLAEVRFSFDHDGSIVLLRGS